MYSRFNKNIIFVLALLLSPVAVFAADAGGKMTYNPIQVGLISLIVILLIAIMILGNTLLQLSLVYRDKMRADKSTGIKALLLLIAAGITTTGAYAQEAAAATPVGSGMIEGMSSVDFYMLMGVIGMELLVILSMGLSIRNLVRLIRNEPAVLKKAAAKVPFWDKVNAVVPIEKEKDIMLDHDYDGIRELDNNLPPWWKYGFYFTILVAVVYLWYYHAGGNGPSSREEYLAEVQKGEEAKAAYLAKAANNVDENTVTLLDAGGVAAGQAIFEMSCAACHAKDGGGGVGPNLTDDYWLHGGSLKDIFKSVKYGWPDKGMKSWKDDFSPNQIAQLSSYIKSLKGKTPAAPKDKQGELYMEEGESASPADTVTKEATAAL